MTNGVYGSGVEYGSMEFSWSDAAGERPVPPPADPWARWRRAAKIALLLAIPVLIVLGFIFLGAPGSSASGGCGGG